MKVLHWLYCICINNSIDINESFRKILNTDAGMYVGVQGN